MSKVSLRELKQIIREAVRSELNKEQFDMSGGQGATNRSGGRGRSASAENQWVTGGFSMDQLLAAMKNARDENEEEEIRDALRGKLKTAGW